MTKERGIAVRRDGYGEVENIVYGWHFLSADGTAYHGYRPPAVGV